MDGLPEGGVDLKTLTGDQLREMERMVVEERQRRTQEEVALAEANRLAAAYHAQVPCDMHNGVHTWSQPLAPVMGYPSGAVVWHAGEGWHNSQPGVNMTEPGADGHTWTSWKESGIWVGDLPAPEPEPEPDPTLGQQLEHALVQALTLVPGGDTTVYLYGTDAWEFSWRVREPVGETGEYDEDGLFATGTTFASLVDAVRSVAATSTGDNIISFALHVPETMAVDLLPMVTEIPVV